MYTLSTLPKRTTPWTENPPLDSTRPFWYATEFEIGHWSTPRWYSSMHAARRQGVLGVVCCGTSLSPRARARALPVQYFLRGGYKRDLHAFQGRQDIMDALVHLTRQTDAGGRREVTAGEPVLATSLWGMLYADDAGVFSQSPEQLKKLMWVSVVVCVAFDLTISEAKTEIMCLLTKVIRESTTTLGVEIAGQADNPTNEFVYLGGNIGAYTTHGAASGSTPSNCTTDRVLPSSFECSEPRHSRQCCTAASRGARERATKTRCAEPTKASWLGASAGEKIIASTTRLPTSTRL